MLERRLRLFLFRRRFYRRLFTAASRLLLPGRLVAAAPAIAATRLRRTAPLLSWTWSPAAVATAFTLLTWLPTDCFATSVTPHGIFRCAALGPIAIGFAPATTAATTTVFRPWLAFILPLSRIDRSIYQDGVLYQWVSLESPRSRARLSGTRSVR